MKEKYIETQISKALIQMLQNHDLKNLTIKEVCFQAQIGRASFYRYYSSLEDVLNKKALFLMQSWADTYESDSETAPDQVFASLFQHFRDNKEFYTTLYKCGQTQVIINTIKNKLGMYMDLSSTEAYGKSCFAYGLFGWINEWVLQGMQEEPDTLSRLFFEEVKTISGVIGALSDSAEKQMEM